MMWHRSAGGRYVIYSGPGSLPLVLGRGYWLKLDSPLSFTPAGNAAPSVAYRGHMYDSLLDTIGGTPLAQLSELTPLDCLKIIAVSRLMMPELHEIGVDIMDTLQPNAAGMDPKDLKQTFQRV